MLTDLPEPLPPTSILGPRTISGPQKILEYYSHLPSAALCQHPSAHHAPIPWGQRPAARLAGPHTHSPLQPRGPLCRWVVGGAPTCFLWSEVRLPDITLPASCSHAPILPGSWRAKGPAADRKPLPGPVGLKFSCPDQARGGVGGCWRGTVTRATSPHGPLQPHSHQY